MVVVELVSDSVVSVVRREVRASSPLPVQPANPTPNAVTPEQRTRRRVTRKFIITLETLQLISLFLWVVAGWFEIERRMIRLVSVLDGGSDGEYRIVLVKELQIVVFVSVLDEAVLEGEFLWELPVLFVNTLL